MAITHSSKVEVSLHSIRRTHQLSIPKTTHNSRNITTSSHRPTTHRRSKQCNRSTTMGETSSTATVHLDLNNKRSSSNSLQTNGHQCQWIRNLETTTSTFLHPSRHQEHRLPHQAAQAILWWTSLWRSLCILGVWSQQIWKREHSQHPRQHQDCYLAQRDKRSIATASTTYSIKRERLQRSERNHHWVLQDNSIIHKNATTTGLQSQQQQHRKQQPRSNTNGHRRNLP